MIFRFTPIEKILLRLNVIPHPLLDSLTGAVAGRALQVAVKVGVFDSLESGSKSAREVAKVCEIDEAGAIPLLECVSALGYIEKTRDDKFRLTKRGHKFFDKNSPRSMRGMLVFDSEFTFPRLQDLEKSIKSGDPPHSDPGKFTQKEWEVFNDAMVELAQNNAPEVAKLAPLHGEPKKLIDLGGMHGRYAIEYCMHYPALIAHVADFPPLEEHAQKVIARHGMQDRVAFKAKDVLADELEHDYDAALAVHLIHVFSPEKNIQLAKAAYNTLESGGQFIIVDQIIDAAGSSEFSKLFVAALGVMLFNNAGGRTYSYSEVASWLKEVGFVNIRFKKMRTPGFALITATKP